MVNLQEKLIIYYFILMFKGNNNGAIKAAGKAVQANLG